MVPLNIAVFISGNGTNLQAIIDNCASGLCQAQIKFVLSNKADAYGLTRARDAGIKTYILDHKDYKNREDYDRALLDITKHYELDLICLAGFMRVLTPVFLAPYDGRVLNIHPSLLPKYKGLHTHQQALDDRATIHGCSVHIVTPALDDGPILVQRSVPVLVGDTVDTLNDRVLNEEVTAYTEAINLMAARLHS